MARDIQDLGADVFDDTIPESQRRLSPKKRNYIIGLPILGVLLAGVVTFAVIASNLWLQDMDYLKNVQFYFTPVDANDKNAPTPTLTLYKLDPNTKYPKNFRIPEKVEGYKVTAIAPEAFNGHNEIQSVTFTKYVDTVGERAFYGCRGIKKFVWNKALSHIGADAFSDTAFYDNLKENRKDSYYTIPSGILIYLGSEFLKDNTALVSDDITDAEKNNVKTKYGLTDSNFAYFSDLKANSFVSGLFRENEKVVYIDFPSFLVEVNSYTFESCSNLKGITFEHSKVERILDSAFEKCNKLKDITLADSITYLGNYVFSNTGIDKIPELHKVEYIGSGAFKGCKSLVEVHYPASADITDVKKEMFRDCTSLKTIYWGDEENSGIDYITSFGTYAFANTAFEEFIVPKNVQTLMDNVFSGCSKLKKVQLYGNPSDLMNPNSINYDEEGHVLYDEDIDDGDAHFADGTYYLHYDSENPSSSEKFQVAEDGSLTIKFTDVTKPANFNEVEFKFSAEELEELQKPAGFATQYAINDKLNGEDTPIFKLDISADYFIFSSVPNLWPDGVGGYQIGTLGGITGIRTRAFHEYTSLKTIALYDDNYHLYNDTEGYFVFPKSLLTTDLDSFNRIDNYVFDKTKVEHIVFGANVTTIGSYAFYGAADLQTVEFTGNNSLRSIGQNAFQNATSLTSIDLPSSLTSLGANAFNGCVSLTNINIANTSIDNIRSKAFTGCKSITTLDLPANLSSIGMSAFAGMTNLERLFIPASITQINDYAFTNENEDESDPKMPVYFEINFEQLKKVNISNECTDETSYISVIATAGEEKIPGMSYWNGNKESFSEILLSDLAFTGAPTKTNYRAGDYFEAEGLTITATYDDGDTLELDGDFDIEWTDLKAGDTSVTGTYTVGNITKTITVTGITVS